MNSFFLSIGTALVVILLAAFAAPYFVDWSGYRSLFEARAAALIGAPVRVTGGVEARLLPMPYVRFEGVQAGAPANPFVTARAFTMTLAPTPLLRGEFRVTELAIEGLSAHATIGEDGGVAFLPEGEAGPWLNPESVAIERFALSDATLTLFDRRTGEETQLVALNAGGEAASLAGPMKAEGGFRHARTTHSFRLSTGRLDANGLRLKLALVPADRPVSFEADGVARMEEGLPSFEGRVVAQRTPEPRSAAGAAEPREAAAQGIPGAESGVGPDPAGANKREARRPQAPAERPDGRTFEGPTGAVARDPVGEGPRTSPETELLTTSVQARSTGPSADARPLARADTAAAQSPTAMPWRLEARAKADPRRLLLESVEVGYGPEDRRATLTGAASYDLGRGGGLDAVLSSRRLDLDRLFGLEGAPASAL
ncbi:MAG: AsmA family protein, partial [Pseudomonadota bacterium]|nr:AsmA family protein [Pseudomonadota bacterium]